jgi:hypothetical protein
MGFLSIMRMPAKKFSNMSLNARPTATEPNPNAANNFPAVRLGKTIVTAIKIPKVQIRTLNRVTKSSHKDFLILDLEREFLNNPERSLAKNQVRIIAKTAIASIGKSLTKPTHMLSNFSYKGEKKLMAYLDFS